MTMAAFNALHMPALERREARHNLLIGLMPRPPSDEVCRWTLGGPGACALQTNANRSIILGELDERQCHALAEQVCGSVFAGALGPENTAHWFTARAAQLGLAFGEPEPQMIHELREPPRSPGAPGKARRATLDDLALVYQWLAAFLAEALPDDPPGTEEDAARKIGERTILLWEADGEPVSLAATARQTRNGAVIGPVYTPPAFRGRGFAGSVTAAVAEHIFASGKAMACLYTNLLNPYSSRSYAKIGFKPVCPSWHYHRVDAGGGGLARKPD